VKHGAHKSIPPVKLPEGIPIAISPLAVTLVSYVVIVPGGCRFFSELTIDFSGDFHAHVVYVFLKKYVAYGIPGCNFSQHGIFFGNKHLVLMLVVIRAFIIIHIIQDDRKILLIAQLFNQLIDR